MATTRSDTTAKRELAARELVIVKKRRRRLAEVDEIVLSQNARD